MVSQRRRRFEIKQKAKRRLKNKGGSHQSEFWSKKIREVQVRNGVSSPGVQKPSHHFETRNLDLIERLFRNRVHETKAGKSLPKAALAILSVLRKHSLPTYYHNLRVALLASEIFLSKGKDPKMGFYGGALHDI